jgi:hypothetical protein
VPKGSAHALGTAGQSQGTVPQSNHLRRADHRLHTGAAQAIDVEGRRGFPQPGIQGNVARHVGILGPGGNDVAEHRVIDGLRRHTRAPNGLLRRPGTQLRRPQTAQAAAKAPDGGATAIQDHHVLQFHIESPQSIGTGCRITPHGFAGNTTLLLNDATARRTI